MFDSDPASEFEETLSKGQTLTVQDLVAADQIFVTNSLMGAVPAVSIDDAQLGYDSALCDKLTRAVFDGDVLDGGPSVELMSCTGLQTMTARRGRGHRGDPAHERSLLGGQQ